MDKLYDLIIIGGGISGLGIAEAASECGLSTLLIEKDKLCLHTSRSSLRIIHGGFRYLQNFNLPRIFESIKAQSRLLRDYPETVTPLSCYMPLNPFGLKSAPPVQVALWLFKLIGLIAGENVRTGHVLRGEHIPNKGILLENLKDQRFLNWYDAIVTDHAKFAAQIAQKVQRGSVKILEEATCLTVSRRKEGFEIICAVDGETHSLNSWAAINATGPWIDSFSKQGIKLSKPNYSWSKAFNIVLSKQLEPEHAVGLQSLSGRLYFVVPRANVSVIGTDYLPFDGDFSSLNISDKEISDFLSDFNETASGVQLSENDIAEVEIGVLPAKEISESGVKLFGRQEYFADNGYLEILSTKFTTFQIQGQQAVNLIRPYLSPPL